VVVVLSWPAGGPNAAHLLEAYGWGIIDLDGTSHPALLLQLASCDLPRLFSLPRAPHQPAQGISLSPAATRSIILQVADALFTMHSLFMFHGDIKAANVLLLGDPYQLYVALCDMGWVKIMRGAGDYYATPSGTPTHNAPEQAAAALQDCRVDTYSLGLLLLELRAGGLPYELAQLLAKGDAGAVLGFVEKQDGIFASGPSKLLPAELDLVRRCLAPAVGDRRPIEMLRKEVAYFQQSQQQRF